MKRDICVDLDGVLAQYDGWRGVDHIGDPIPGAREFLAELQVEYNIVIFTTRCNPEVNHGRESADLLAKRVEDWLRKHDMPFDHVYRGVGKPLCAAFIDDNCIRILPQRFNGDYARALEGLSDMRADQRARAESKKRELGGARP